MSEQSSTGEQLIEQYGENSRITGGDYDSSLAVRCINGTFVGKRRDNIIAFKGIPFVGKQPVGEYRWKAPVDYTPDDGIYEAYYNGKTCPQPEGDVAASYCQGEDCLYLNIWKADEAGAEKKPVMVWIYGGAFETGGTADPNYEGHNFIEENPDVILVSVGYRVGILGFCHLSHLPDGADYTDSPNLGLLDQKMALKWVHDNIAAFGGDSENVTIWGESAGAASCTLLPLIEGSQKYFKRVIAESGAPTQTRSPEEAITCTKKVMEELGCRSVADLLKVGSEELVNTAGRLFGLYQVLGIRTFPERDGKYLPLEPWKAYADGAAKDIVFLHGCNKNEFNTFVPPFGVETFVKWGKQRKEENLARLTDEEKELVESYFQSIQGDEYEPYCCLFGQMLFIAPQIRLAEEQAKAGGRSYTYYFTAESSLPIIKAGHMLELPTLFKHPEDTSFTGREYDETFGRIMRKMWVQFAKTGSPSLGEDISPDGKAYEWPVYDLEDRKVMVLDEFDIHPEKEAEIKIVDWDRTYFLTNYYVP
ncbi:MAG: carboxylesterase family protein [Lachnospiraceae bacterium]|nr:carboxylesterase family protein [Lachnospiraceae bacterium]